MFSLPAINTESTLNRKIGIQDPNLLPSIGEYLHHLRNKGINFKLLCANLHSHWKKNNSVLPKYSAKSLKRGTIHRTGPERPGKKSPSLVSDLVSVPCV